MPTRRFGAPRLVVYDLTTGAPMMSGTGALLAGHLRWSREAAACPTLSTTTSRSSHPDPVPHATAATGSTIVGSSSPSTNEEAAH